jgi:hypothetical protein
VKSEKTKMTLAVFSEAYERKAIKKSIVYEWHEWFKEGHENMENDERSGHPRPQKNC